MRRASAKVFLLLSSLLLAAPVREASGQGMMPPMQSPAMSKGRAKPAVADPKQPVTHAASGDTDDLPKVTGAEPTLPANPLEMDTNVQGHIGTDADLDKETGRAEETRRRFYGLWYSEDSGSYHFKTLIPLWLERRQPGDRASMFSPLYFNRRSKEHDADVLFPLFWNLREGQSRTTIVGPVMHHTAPGESDTWVAPLLFSGVRKDGGYLHIPPLLTFGSRDKDGGFRMYGPLYCSWKGGTSCSPSHADDIDYGLAPFFFAGRSEKSRYELAPPLLHYFHFTELTDSSINVWGPLVWRHTQEYDAFNILPLFWHSWGKNEDHLTVFPLFHYGYQGNSSLFINPLFLTARGEKGESTFVTWGYARYRGRTELDMVTPLYWRFEDPDIGLKKTLALPFYYHSNGPRGYETAIFPFWMHSKTYGLSETTWVTPFFQHTHDIEGWQTNIHPLVYLGRSNNSSHTVVAPFFWDFASPNSRTTIGFPAYWRFADDRVVSQLALNTYYRERKVTGGSDWEFHFFPAFSYGQSPDGHWWNLLYGLAGYTRRGPMTQVRALWIPITLSSAPE